ncbi:hypothetical protein [Novosphingobium huizhouense]|uniref:hypothetical protein n=1 Tax=Novosphingobium huizhouense TaxID=2866625 RepID=UPI001CD900ED|nr:hypothetical protein [Novosphingobium huizhouense]
MFTLAVLILFWLMLLANMASAAIFGRALERIFAGTLCLISVAVLAASAYVAPAVLAGIGIASDGAILLLAWAVALRSDRYWPLWFAAMQSLAIVTQLVSALAVAVPHLVFTNLAAVWSLPALLLMTWGTIADWRARRAPPERGKPGRAARA